MNRRELFYTLLEIYGWVKIVLSPLLTGFIIGGLFYLYFRGELGQILFGLLTLTGLVIGVFWGNHIYDKYGTIWFWSRLMATPELDDPNQIDTTRKTQPAKKDKPKDPSTTAF